MEPTAGTARRSRIHVQLVVEYAAMARPTRQYRAGEIVGRPIGLIRIGTPVKCRDGPGGRVVGIVAHPERGYASDLIVRCGRIRRRSVRVALSWVIGIAPDYVVLQLRKADLAGQPEYRSDDEIAERVAAALHDAPAALAHDNLMGVTATVKDGVVRIRGNVCTARQRLAVEQLVGSISGVIGITNYLFTDDEIEWQIAWALQHDRRLHITGVRVEALLGLVRLRGSVATAAERSLAATVARQAPGVMGVLNALQLQTEVAGAGTAEPPASGHCGRSEPVPAPATRTQPGLHVPLPQATFPPHAGPRARPAAQRRGDAAGRPRTASTNALG